MNITAEKVAPLTVVLAVAGYCAWPSATELMNDPKPKPVKKPAELSAALFSPQLAPPAVRNPFAVEQLHAAEPTGPIVASVEDDAVAKELSALTTPAESPPDPLRGLKLEATCVNGDRWLAMINGRLYASHDELATDDAAAGRIKVVNVQPYRVTLERDGRMAELTYSNMAARAEVKAKPERKAQSSPERAPVQASPAALEALLTPTASSPRPLQHAQTSR